jgi:hypothetical protein
MKLLVALTIFLFSAPAFAGESGIIFQGKKIVLFKDGKRVGQEPKEARGLASVKKLLPDTLYYRTDTENRVICYSPYNFGDAISCLKM